MLSAVIETASSIVNSSSDLLDSILGFVPKLVATCALIAASFPPPDPKVKPLFWLSRTINLIGMNVGHAKNEKRCD